MVSPKKNAEGLVNKPIAKSIPPKNSDKAAAQPKKEGKGKPKLAVALINPSEGGILPIPCANAMEIPVKRRKAKRAKLVVEDLRFTEPNNSVLYMIRSNSLEK